MRRTFLYVCMTLMMLCVCMNAKAQTVSPEDAKAKAKAFFSKGAKKLPAGKEVKSVAPKVSNIELAYTSKKDGKTCFYVFNNGADNGFVIVGGDEVAKDILAYIPQGHFCYDSIPDNVKWWLGEYEEGISTAIKLAPKSQKQGVSAPRRVTQSNNQLDVHSFFSDIPSMITTKWGQEAPYNSAIPLPENVEGSAPTGCVATALAQIMKYWEYPSRGAGSFSYDWTYENPTFTMTYSADFGNTTYDWNNMLDDYNLGEPTQGQIDAVSTLMYHAGVATHTIYSSGASSVTSIFRHKTNIEVVGLFRFFNYDLKACAVLRNDITDEDWESIIYTELKAGRPVYYSGVNEMAGHAFVCDGYNSSLKMFSFNWGWNGSADGYYSLCGTNMVNGFTSNQSIITHLQPAGHDEPNFAQYNDHIVVDGFHYIILNPYLKRVALTNSNLEEDEIYSGNIVVPDSIVYNGEIYSVTLIDTDAFEVIGYSEGRDWYPWARGSAVTSVTLPETVTHIGSCAFSGCRELTTINLSENLEKIPVGCFADCSSLDLNVLGNNIQSIGQLAFSNCTSISKIVIPGTALKYIGWGAFEGCTNLVSIDLPSSLEFIDGLAFNQTNLRQMICRSLVVPAAGTVTFSGAPIQEGTLYVPDEAINDYSDDDKWNFWKGWGEIKSIDEMPQNDYLGVKISYNGLNYMLLGNSKATVIGYTDIAEELVIPGRIFYEGISFDVYSISARAFSESSIKKLRITEGVKEIGAEAFQSCYSLAEVELPSSIEKLYDAAFRNNEQLKRIVIPGNVKIVKSSAFGYCSSLEEVILNEGVEQLEPSCFDQCTSLRKVVVPSTMMLFGGGCFRNCNSLEEFVSFSPIIYNARADYDYLANSLGLSFSYSGSVEDCVDFSLDTIHGTLYVNESDIEFYQNNSNWKRWENIQPIVPCISISLGNQSYALSTGDTLQINALYNPINTTCKQLFWTSSDPAIASVDDNGVVTAHKTGTATISATSMYYPGISSSCTVTVTPSLVGSQFEKDGILYEITKTGAIIVGYNESNNITELIIPSPVENEGKVYTVYEIGENAFYECGLTKVTIPASVTTIGDASFAFCTSLTEVKILGGVTEIGMETSAFCSNLESIELPSALETIGDMAFLGCASLKTITLPSKVSLIGDAAFSGCTGLESITSNNPVPPTCTQAAFAATEFEGELVAGVNKDIPVYVPDGKVSDYKTGGWLYFNETITKVEDSLIGDAVEVERYDISGRKISKPVQGVNIVRYSNGAVRKEVR